MHGCKEEPRIYKENLYYLILLHKECMGNTFFTSSSSSPNSMNIIFCSQRKTIVDHYFNIWNIQSSRGHISSNLLIELLSQIYDWIKQQKCAECLRDHVIRTLPTTGIHRSPYNDIKV